MPSALAAALKFDSGALREEADALEQAARSWLYLNDPRRDVAAHMTEAAAALRKAARLLGSQK